MLLISGSISTVSGFTQIKSDERNDIRRQLTNVKKKNKNTILFVGSCRVIATIGS